MESLLKILLGSLIGLVLWKFSTKRIKSSFYYLIMTFLIFHLMYMKELFLTLNYILLTLVVELSSISNTSKLKIFANKSKKEKLLLAVIGLALAALMTFKLAEMTKVKSFVNLGDITNINIFLIILFVCFMQRIRSIKIW